MLPSLIRLGTISLDGGTVVAYGVCTTRLHFLVTTTDTRILPLGSTASRWKPFAFAVFNTLQPLRELAAQASHVVVLVDICQDFACSARPLTCLRVCVCLFMCAGGGVERASGWDIPGVSARVSRGFLRVSTGFPTILN